MDPQYVVSGTKRETFVIQTPVHATRPRHGEAGEIILLEGERAKTYTRGDTEHQSFLVGWGSRNRMRR
jgi:hypothetical protein